MAHASLGSKTFLEAMVNARWPVILQRTPYSEAAAVRYGPSGVRVNTVHPGYMPPMLNATSAGECADKIAMTPLRRIGKPIEVAYGVLFLASDEASFITVRSW
jgi:NAD(P)-dependent dehydrogenase (short-subunit alcohol dehydrogenase family)